MNLTASLANAAWLASCVPAWQRFRRALVRPAETQWAILRRVLADNADSAYGRAHGFAAIASVREFQARVPAVGYDDLRPWVDRITRGEPSVLTSEPVTRLLPTSGSASARKLIPFTAGLQRGINRAVAPWLVDLCGAYPTVPLGTAYWSVSPAIRADAADADSAVPVGFDADSAYLGGIQRRLVEATFAVPSVLRLVSDIASFRYLTLLCLLRQPDWTFASVWHPSFLTLLLDALPLHWDELLRDLSDGSCPRAREESLELRRAVQGNAQPRRARALQRCGPHDPHALWPRLRVVSCWGDGQAAPAFAGLRRRLPRIAVQTKGLLATEAFVSIPFQGQHPLAITSHVFEFAAASGEILLAHELRRGEQYTVIVTTGGGLYRYRLGDIVEVDGFIAATPSLRFIGREGGGCDLYGEKLTEPFVTAALQAACSATHFEPSFTMLAPDSSPPHYICFVEGQPAPGFAVFLDAELRHNPHYALARDLGQLGAVELVVTPPGAYEIFSRAGIAQGRRLGDIKPQSLSARTDWREVFAKARAGQPPQAAVVNTGRAVYP